MSSNPQLTGKTVCLVEDPATKRHQPRNYLQTLEQRVAYLERILRRYQPDVANDHLFQSDSQPVEIESSPTALTQPLDHHYGDQAASSPGDDEHDGLDDLASKVGLLSLNAAGAEPHYLGSSSTFAFSRLIDSSLRQVVLRNGMSTDNFSPNEVDLSALPTPCLLPDYDTAVRLSNAYFRNIHSQYPFLHEPTFRAWEAMLADRSVSLDTMLSDPIPLFFLYMVSPV